VNVNLCDELSNCWLLGGDYMGLNKMLKDFRLKGS
jgi:hypothetical protein